MWPCPHRAALLLCLVAVLLVCPPAHPQPSPTVEESISELKELIRLGNYAEAEGGARALLEKVEAASGAESAETAPVLDVLVDALLRGGKAAHPETRAAAERSLAVRERSLGPDHAEVAASLENLGHVHLDTSDLKGARAAFERALVIREKALPADHPSVAESLDALANLLVDAGEMAAAKPLFERALAIREKRFGPDDLKVASSASNLGRFLFLAGDYAAAEAQFRRVLAIREKRLPADHPERSAVLNNLGSVCQARGEYAEARRLYRLALEIKEKALPPGHPDLGLQSFNLGLLEWKTGEYAAAKTHYERALDIFETSFGPEHPNVAAALEALGDLQQTMGDYTSARRLYERALSIEEKVLGADHPGVAFTLNSLAGLDYMEGDLARSRRLNERALAIREKALGPDSPETAQSLGNLGLILYELGDHEVARRYLERSLAIHEKIAGPENPDVAADLLGLAGIARASGGVAESRTFLERALAVREKALGPEHQAVAEARGLLADFLVERGEFEMARTLFERSLAIYEKALGPGNPKAAQAHGGVAKALAAAGEFRAARLHQERAVAILDSALGPDHPETAPAVKNLAVIDWAEGRALSALDRALQAEAIARQQFQRDLRRLAEREALGYQGKRVSGLSVAMSVLAGAAPGVPEQESARRVWDALVRSRALVLDEIASRHMAELMGGDAAVRSRAAEVERAGNWLARLLVKGSEREDFQDYRAQVREARLGKEGAERALAEVSAAFREDQSVRRAGLEEVSAALPRGSALVAYALFDRLRLSKAGAGAGVKGARPPAGVRRPAVDELPAFLVFILRSGERFPRVVDLGAAGEIDSLVGRWREQIGSARGKLPGADRGAESRYLEAADRLRRRIWDPLQAHLGDVRQVFVVPDGELHLVSFAALPGANGGYLVEAEPVLHYLSTERDLLRAGAARQKGKGLLVAGAPDFDADPVSTTEIAGIPAAGSPARANHYRGSVPACREFRSLRFVPLPSAAAELIDVEAIWSSGRAARGDATAIVRLSGREATESAIKTAVEGRRVIHLATHGFFELGACVSRKQTSGRGGAPSERDGPRFPEGVDSLQLSGLALAGANRRGEIEPSGEGEDGVLTAEEIASLDLSGAEWVVLSACDTGVGKVLAGEGVLGLRRGFQIAGAGTLIMSLWAVEDSAAREWVRELYAQRIAGSSTAQAVRQASLKVLEARRRAGGSTHPFYWGAFVAAGDWK